MTAGWLRTDRGRASKRLMSNSVGRRDTLKLASAAAALGAGLGLVLKASDALADVAPMVPMAPGIKPVAHPLPPRMTIGPEAQLKITTFEKLAMPKGSVQLKIASAAGQFLYAANVPDEIAQLMTGGAGGQLQIKFWRPVAARTTTPAAVEPFAEGLIQLVPSSGKR